MALMSSFTRPMVGWVSRGEEGPWAGDRTQVITRPSRPGAGTSSGTFVGGRRGRQQALAASQASLSPTQEGGGDKRVDLSGGWNTGEEGGGAPGQALAPHTGWGGWVPHPLPPRGHRLTESYLKPGLCTLGTSLS